MVKPATLDGYTDQYTVDCERVLVTLLRGLGPWKDSVFLVGGLDAEVLGGGKATGSSAARGDTRRGYRHRPADSGRHRDAYQHA